MNALKQAALIVAAQIFALVGYLTVMLFLLWGYDGIALPIMGGALVAVGAAWAVLRGRP